MRAPWPGAVAVSGGGDSLALMHLLPAGRRPTGVAPPVVLTVDHGLAPEFAKRMRARSLRWAKALGLKAHVLSWQGPKPEADIEAAAREARYRLMGDWLTRTWHRQRSMSATPTTIRPRHSCCVWRAAAGWTAWRPCGPSRPIRCRAFASCVWCGRCSASSAQALRAYLRRAARTGSKIR